MGYNLVVLIGITINVLILLVSEFSFDNIN